MHDVSCSQVQTVWLKAKLAFVGGREDCSFAILPLGVGYNFAEREPMPADIRSEVRHATWLLAGTCDMSEMSHVVLAGT